MAAPTIEVTFLLPDPMAPLTVTVPALASVGFVRDKAREELHALGCLELGGVVHLFMATGQFVNGVPERVELNTNEIPVVALGTLNFYVEVETFQLNPTQSAAFYSNK